MILKDGDYKRWINIIESDNIDQDIGNAKLKRTRKWC